MHDFQSIAKRVFEEYRVVARCLKAWSFDIPGTDLEQRTRERIDFGAACRSECDAVCIRPKAVILSDSEKLAGVFCFELKPTLNLRLAYEAQLRQQAAIERDHRREVRHAKVDMVEARGQSSLSFRLNNSSTIP